MSANAWQLEGNTGRLIQDQWRATVDLSRPRDGLRLEVAPFDAAPAPWGVLAVMFGDDEPIDAGRIDSYVRGSDLVANYSEAPPAQLRTQIYWRSLLPAEFSPAHASKALAAFDLIVSVTTPLLDCNPEAAVRAVLPGAEVLNLRCRDQGECAAVAIDAPPYGDAPGSPTSCFIVRPPGGRLSYLEMVHPSDYVDSRITTGDSAPPRVRIMHQLFQSRLEKGVILRARVRAGLVNREHDAACAAEAYRQFAASEAPLTV